MPYIERKDRANCIADFGIFPRTPGELNFTISDIIDNYLARNLSYHSINEVIGALECAKLELYRRIAAPYEDKKLKENGDVYTVRGNES